MYKRFAVSNAIAEKQSDINEKLIDRLAEKPRKCIGIKYDRGQMTMYKQYLVCCIKNQLIFFDKDGEEYMKITFDFDIDDLCWSSSLDRLLILSTNELHSLHLETKEIQLIKTFDHKWTQCAVNQDTFLVTIGNYKTNIEIYKLDNWELFKRFEPPLSAKNYQYITQLRFNSSGTKLGVALGGGEQRIFQLRISNDMTILQSIDLVHFSGCTSYYMCPLPNDEFFVHAFLENEILLIDSNGQFKKNISYNDGQIISTALINDSSKYLVLQIGKHLTTKMNDDDCYVYELHFFELDLF